MVTDSQVPMACQEVVPDLFARTGLPGCAFALPYWLPSGRTLPLSTVLDFVLERNKMKHKGARKMNMREYVMREQYNRQHLRALGCCLQRGDQHSNGGEAEYQRESPRDAERNDLASRGRTEERTGLKMRKY